MWFDWKLILVLFLIQLAGNSIFGNADEEEDQYLYLNYYAPFLHPSGYGTEALNLAFSLSQISLLDEKDENRFVFGVVQFGQVADMDFFHNEFNETEQKLINDMLFVGEEMKKHHKDRYGFVVCHATPDAFYPSLYPGWDNISPCPPPNAKQLIKIARTMTEMNRIQTKEWCDKLRQFDAIVVPSKFTQEGFINSGIPKEKMYILNEPIDVDLFHKVDHCTRVEKETDSFDLLSVFKFEYRKGWDKLLLAYFNEFKNQKDVTLHIKTEEFYNDQPIEIIIDKFKKENFPDFKLTNFPNLNLTTEYISRPGLPSIYCDKNVFVLPTRGEGWGLPIVEAMSMEIPVIVTNFSAPADYLRHNDTGYLIKLESLSEASLPKGKILQNRAYYGEASVDDLRKLLRFAYNDYKIDNSFELKRIGKNARNDMVKRFHPAKIGDDLINVIASIEHDYLAKHGKLYSETTNEDL